MKRSLVGILLIPALLAVVLLAISLPAIIARIQGPSDDPSLLCLMPDPTPIAETDSAQLILQSCAAGETFTMRRGDTIAVDLTGSGGVDTAGTFHGLTVSDSSILSTVVGPRTIDSNLRAGTPGRFFDYYAVYRAAGEGRATMSALLNSCGNFGCRDTNRWRATIKVT